MHSLAQTTFAGIDVRVSLVLKRTDCRSFEGEVHEGNV